ncbi:MAG: UDP-N-acetylglucosamine 2-epimerase (non-hydrolyzing) [Actinobacteria bacterium]|nr:UDP-N-acetylglucosamine 2-epimerase (non-hydrolyzing) [Actinomycetota bacterium]
MANQPLVVHVVGARPNYMKVAPVYGALEKRGNVEQRLIHTGQHYDALMKDVFFAELPLPRPHVELDAQTTDDALIGLERAFGELEPDLVVVAGDVTSTLAGAVAAAKRNLMLCHIESGLRSNNWRMPEERNRVITDHLSQLLLTHSREADANLAAEGVDEDLIEFVGNTMIDTLRANEKAARALAAWKTFGVEPKGYILVTLHRQRLFEEADLLRRTVAALDEVSKSLPVIFPAHPRTQKAIEEGGLADHTTITLTPSIPYRQFLSLEIGAAAVITDSGGVPEETTALGVPCFTLRDETERPVTVEVGTNTVLGQDPDELRTVPSRLANPKRGEIPELWDGRAGERAADAVERLLLRAEVTA